MEGLLAVVARVSLAIGVEGLAIVVEVQRLAAANVDDVAKVHQIPVEATVNGGEKHQAAPMASGRHQAIPMTTRASLPKKRYAVMKKKYFQSRYGRNSKICKRESVPKQSKN